MIRNIKHLALALAIFGAFGSAHAESEVNNKPIQFATDSELQEITGAKITVSTATLEQINRLNEERNPDNLMWDRQKLLTSNGLTVTINSIMEELVDHPTSMTSINDIKQYIKIRAAVSDSVSKMYKNERTTYSYDFAYKKGLEAGKAAFKAR